MSGERIITKLQLRLGSLGTGACELDLQIPTGYRCFADIAVLRLGRYQKDISGLQAMVLSIYGKPEAAAVDVEHVIIGMRMGLDPGFRCHFGSGDPKDLQMLHSNSRLSLFITFSIS